MTILQIILKYKFRITAIFIISLLIILVTMISPLVLSRFIDSVIAGVPLYSPKMVLYFTIIGLGGLSIVLLSYVSNLIANKTKINIIKNLKVTLLKRYLEANPENSSRIKDMITIIQNDIHKITDLVLSGVNKVVINVAKFIGISVILFKMNNIIYYIIIAFIPIYIIVLLLTIKKKYNYSKVIRETHADITNILANIMQNKKSIFLTNSVDVISNNSEKKISVLCNQIFKSNNFSNLSNSVLSILSVILDFIVLIFSVYMVYRNTITVGEMTVFISYSKRLITPVRALINFLFQYQNIKPSYERIKVLTSIPIENYLHSTANINTISFKNVKPYFTSFIVFDLDIKANGIISIYGNTGSGKSTIGNLIAGYLVPYSGNVIFYDDNNQSYNSRDIRGSIRLIDCEMLFISSLSLRDNITLGKRISDSYLVDLLNVFELYDQFHNNLDSLVENLELSHGELQRLLIIRNLLDKPQILILDEALSGIESELANKIINYIKRISKTIIIISHRLSDHSLSDKAYIISKHSLKKKLL